MIIFALLMLLMNDCVLKVRYIPAANTDFEHGQGSIERNELAHREIEPLVWLVRVEKPDRGEWERKLTTSAGGNGRFEVELPTDDEQRRIDAGEITFQR
jgi:hypothetical protein